MESSTVRNCASRIHLMLLITLVMIALDFIAIDVRSNKGNKTRKTAEFTAEDNSFTSKISSFVSNFSAKNRSKFGNYGNLSHSFETVSQTKDKVIWKLISERLITVSKHLETIYFISLKNRKTNQWMLCSLSIIDSQALLTIAIFLKCVHFLLTKKCQNSIKSKNEKLCSYGFLFHLTNGRQYAFNVYMYHNSLKHYLNELEKDSDKSNKCMHNEWARLESFKAFPGNCPVSTLKLAKAGFYSSNNGQEAVCFCCGLKNEVWTDTETVNDVHRRLSPECKFINGETTENVSIHDDDKETKSGACGGQEDTLPHRLGMEQSKETNSANELSFDSELNIGSQNRNHSETSSNHSQESERSLFVISNRGRYSGHIPTEEIQHFPGIINEIPKHLEYAIKSMRVSSFTLWPSTNCMKPEDLAEAGFFFSGVQDLVRCFFCGGGMKNWEYGDSPWIEHARWFSTCAYLKQCKGEDFVNLCQMSNMSFPTQNNFQMRDLDSQRTDLVADQQITDLNSIAAKIVLDMGYTQPQVEEAIKQSRQRIGPSTELKAQNILEHLLDNNYTPVSAPRSTTSTLSLQGNTPGATNGNISPRSSSPVASGRKLSPKEEREILEEENRNLKNQMMCKVCMDKDANTVLLPCGHLVACVDCANALRKCAVCRKVIQGTVRAYPA